MRDVRIGVVGYYEERFDEDKAITTLQLAYDEVIRLCGRANHYTVVSNLFNFGIPPLAYRMAQLRDWKTHGVGSAEARKYLPLPVDSYVIVGEKRGQEYIALVESCDILIRIGSNASARFLGHLFRGLKGGIVIEYELEAL